MKKREVIKQQNKLKNSNSIKWLRYASYVSIGLVVLLLLLVGCIMMMNKVSFNELVDNNPFIGLSFTIAVENLFAWYVLRKAIENVQALKHLEATQMILVVLAVVEIIMMNFVSGILILIGLVKCFDWSFFSFSKILKQMKKEKQIKNVIGVVSIQVLLGYCFLLLSFLLYNLK